MSRKHIYGCDISYCSYSSCPLYYDLGRYIYVRDNRTNNTKIKTFLVRLIVGYVKKENGCRIFATRLSGVTKDNGLLKTRQEITIEALKRLKII